MPDRYQGLRDAIAAGPTPGPWRVSAGIVDNPRLIVEDDIGMPVCAMSLRGVHGDLRKMEANADLIAAADPDTIAALLKERDALREALAAIAKGAPLVRAHYYYESIARAALAALADGEASNG